MTGLTIAPSLHNPAGRNPFSTLLLTDASNQAKPEAQSPKAGTAQAAPMHPHAWNGNYAQIQAQLLNADKQRTFRRPTASSPRDAARAYAQARRRPQSVSDMPCVQSVV